MIDLQKYYDMVELCITNLGVNPETCRGKNAGQWSLIKGSARVSIDVWYIEKEKRAYFQVMSPVSKVPEGRKEEFFQELLQINDKLFGVAFSLYKETAWLKVIREVDAMDYSEAFAMITRIGNYSDTYDDQLKAKYFGGGGGNDAGQPNSDSNI